MGVGMAGTSIDDSNTSWIKTLFWGTLACVLYWGLFHFAHEILRFAHTTGDACVVNQGGETLYYSTPTAEACATKNGTLVEGNWLYVFIPILIAFAVSYIHGAFTAAFWDSLGFKAAPNKK